MRRHRDARQNVSVRRGERITARTGGVAVVAAAVLACGALIVQGAAPVTPRPVEDEVPEEIFWPLVNSCTAASEGPLVGVLFDQDGAILPDVGYSDAENGIRTDAQGIPVVDEAASARLRGCLSSYRVQFSPRNARQSTAGERLLIYRWTATWQVPCLSAHGIRSTTPPPAQMLDPQSSAPWLLLASRDWVPGSYDFDAVLAARRACDPIPPFLTADGVYW